MKLRLVSDRIFCQSREIGQLYCPFYVGLLNRFRVGMRLAFTMDVIELQRLPYCERGMKREGMTMHCSGTGLNMIAAKAAKRSATKRAVKARI